MIDEVKMELNSREPSLKLCDRWIREIQTLSGKVIDMQGPSAYAVRNSFVNEGKEFSSYIQNNIHLPELLGDEIYVFSVTGSE